MPDAPKVTNATSDNAGATLRYVMVVIGSILLSRQVISKEMYDQYMKGIPEAVTLILLLAPYFQSLWAKWRGRQHTERMVQAALDLPTGSTKADVVAIVPPPPGVISKITGAGKTPLPLLIVALAITLALSALTLLASGCRSFTLPDSSSKVANVEQAAKCLAILGQSYETGMEIVSELRAAGKVTDSQWAVVDDAQSKVNLYGPKLVDAVELWRQFGTRGAFDAAYDPMKAAIDQVVRVQKEVQ